ncbi:DNA protecting protein DprA [Desulfuromusa kysingii]|uniref:DNA protecting protein DprA n=1 Tax=Desulfuromusa kysingii TaxID=37625 RepID=A0A1H3WVV1_9BACT|nr:DNA-processing protein DprA [Desulfuromusa kysingii]SDZ91286.1 DNA protecting protein DprA [Desulfuromusa kysingii]
MNDEQVALLRLHLTPGIGRSALFKLHQYFGDFLTPLQAPPQYWQEAGLSAKFCNKIPTVTDPKFATIRHKLESLKVRLLSFWDSDYPPLLREIHDPPALLYLRGTLPDNECFAIVGSRRATPGGLTLSRELATALAHHNICIVSGLARGVDSAAHKGALDANGSTIAVLGCGIDRVYPPENSHLFHRIEQANAIITEYPPETPPLPGHFPGRNRIISGLSRGVLIIEAAAKSGSLITGDFALEQGRELFAVPGSLQHRNSKGTNQLLKEGAQLVTEAADILQALWPDLPSQKQQRVYEDFSLQLEEVARNVYQKLGHEPKHSDEIARECGLTPMELSAILLDLELRGGIKTLPGNNYIREQI